MRKINYWIVAIIVAIIVGAGLYICETDSCLFGGNGDSEITNFQKCIEAGYPAMESHPRQCQTKDGRTFTEVIAEARVGINIEPTEIEDKRE